jgi:hypothetical protein
MSTVRYYDGWSHSADKALPADEAMKRVRHTRAIWRDDGRVERDELYDRGRLLRVDYYDAGSAEEIASVHTALHPGVLRMVYRALGGAGDYTWTCLEAVTEGQPARRAILLKDRDDHETMTIEQDGHGVPFRIEKSFWGRSGNEDNLKYAFEYDRSGQLTVVTDLEYGDTTTMEDIAEVLADWGFYATGFALPRDIATTPIPVC